MKSFPPPRTGGGDPIGRIPFRELLRLKERLQS